ncbi:GntR family transcriptional regulator [Haloactinopolyspora alba]|uniref:GntR family transcriptional regulator n=1 Tax=Haloactinopolyspora alba TaxID=648780 RepID=A0A2P8DZ74_9ACTN|nr:GntR family transcriptional regulator [Haloactinopolyspora alba]PSL02516.1 GntR family transcriptional regulator [Haloactinopolyspora alba]
MAKYHSIRDEILDLVAELGVGDALPPERALAPRFGVSRMTLRRAVEELVREGRLVRRQGAGTFVAGPKIAQGLAVSSFSEDMRHRGAVPSSRTLDIDDVLAGAPLGRRLEISPGEEVLRVVRLRLADDAPMAVETLHVPRSIAPGLDGEMLADGSFYELLQDVYGVAIASGVQTIEATVTDEVESDALEVPLHSPAFLFERISRDGDGRVVEFVRSVYRGDRYQFRVDLQPTRPAKAVQ